MEEGRKKKRNATSSGYHHSSGLPPTPTEGSSPRSRPPKREKKSARTQLVNSKMEQTASSKLVNKECPISQVRLVDLSEMKSLFPAKVPTQITSLKMIKKIADLEEELKRTLPSKQRKNKEPDMRLERKHEPLKQNYIPNESKKSKSKSTLVVTSTSTPVNAKAVSKEVSECETQSHSHKMKLKERSVVVLPPNIVEVEVDGVTLEVDVHQELGCVVQVNKEAEAETELGESEDLSQRDTPGTSVDPDQLLSPTPVKSQSALKSNKLFRKSIRKSEGKNVDFAKTPTGRKYKHHFQEVKKLPEAVFRINEDYKMDDAPPRPNNAYIRYIDRTPEELAEMVEYDLDELDVSWLQDHNRIRLKEGLPEVHQDVMELLMDRLEKESYFQMQSSGMEQGPIIDDDAVCCICMDGECQNANAILFCDMCNLAVHQECYGVPYIPEGQWLCRRCLLSPSIAVDCILCPNKGGAFKETECKRWAHVVCAIWIPEVRFANAVFLEPVDNIKSIPASRWRLCCFICKQKGVGACIRCYKCYTAFHVTCALQAGLYMQMETVRLASAPGVTVKKTAFCDKHAPPDFIAERDSRSETARQKLKQIPKMLGEKRCAPPVVSVPTIPPEQIAQISSSVNFTKKNVFMKKLMAYWKLKRMQRNGVPLLRRLQVASSVGSKSSRKYDASQNEVNSENYGEIMRIRQDLEKGRLLCELTRKREKIKREVINARIQVWDMRIQPFNYFLSSIVDDLCSKDSQSIFTQHVDPEHVPDYPSVVKNPMDLSTMRRKIFEFAYDTIDDLQADFQLMINNCKLYNSKDTVLYRAAKKMQVLGGIVFREAKRAYEKIGFKGGVHTKIPPPQYTAISPPIDEAQLQSEIENVIEDKGRNSLQYEEHINILEETIDKCLLISHPASRKKKFLRVKKEIYKLKKVNCLIEEGASGSGLGGDQSSMDEDEVAASPFDMESSDAAEEGREALVAGARTPRHISSIRRRLRSTDAERSARLQQSSRVSPTSSRVLRRVSRSSETLTVPAPTSETISAVSRFPSQPQPLPPLPPTAFIIPSPNTARLKHSEMGLPVGFKRGQPGKFPTQRGRRARLRSSSRTLPSPQRQLSTSPRLQRGGAHRGGRGRGRRNLRKPLRRSGRVAEQQQLLQQAAQGPSVNPSAKEEDPQGSPSRQVSPTRSGELPKMSVTTPQRRTGSRHASPTQVAPPRISSSRTTSPIGSLNKSQRPTRQHSPVAPVPTGVIPATCATLAAPVSPSRPNPVRTLPKRQASPTSSIGGKSQQVRLVSPGAGSPGTSVDPDQLLSQNDIDAFKDDKSAIDEQDKEMLSAPQDQDDAGDFNPFDRDNYDSQMSSSPDVPKSTRFRRSNKSSKKKKIIGSSSDAETKPERKRSSDEEQMRAPLERKRDRGDSQPRKFAKLEDDRILLLAPDPEMKLTEENDNERELDPEVPMEELIPNPFTKWVFMEMMDNEKEKKPCELPDLDHKNYEIGVGIGLKLAWWFNKCDFGPRERFHRFYDSDTELSDSEADENRDFGDHNLLPVSDDEEEFGSVRVSTDEFVDAGRALLTAKYRTGPGDTFENIFHNRGGSEEALKNQNYQVYCTLCRSLVVGNSALAAHVQTEKHRRKMENLGDTDPKSSEDEGKAKAEAVKLRSKDKKKENVAAASAEKEREPQKIGELVNWCPSEDKKKGESLSGKEKKDKERESESDDKDREEHNRNRIADDRERRNERERERSRHRSRDRSPSKESKEEREAEIGVTSTANTGLSLKIPSSAMPNRKRRSRSKSRSRSPRRDRKRVRSPLRVRRSRSPRERHSRTPVERIAGSPARLRELKDQTRSSSVERRMEKFVAENSRRRSPSASRSSSRSRSRSPSNNPLNRKRDNREFNQKLTLTAMGLWTDDLEQKWKLVEMEEAMFIEQFLEKKKSLNDRPENYPTYAEEWAKFWGRRSLELEKEGINSDDYNYLPEWKKFWQTTMNDLLETELQEKLAEIRMKHGMDINSLLKIAKDNLNNEPTVKATPVPAPVPAPVPPPSTEPTFLLKSVVPPALSTGSFTDDMGAKPMSISSEGGGSNNSHVEMPPQVQTTNTPAVPPVTVTPNDFLAQWKNMTSVPSSSTTRTSTNGNQQLNSSSLAKTVDAKSVTSSSIASIDLAGFDLGEVLRLLSTMEDQLSFPAPQTKEYFKRAEECELKKHNKSLELMEEKDFVLLLTQIRDRLIPLSRSPLQSVEASRRLQMSLESINVILETPQCKKHKIASPTQISPRQESEPEIEGVDDADRDRLQNLPPGIRLMILKERALKSPKITPLVAIPSSNEDNRLRGRRRRHHKRNKKRSGQDSCRRRLIMTAPTVSSARSDKKSQRQNENTETEGVDDADRDRLQNLPPGIRLMILKERALKSPKITPLVAIPSSNEDNRLRRRRRRHHKRNKKRSGQDSCRRRLIMTAPTVSSARSDKKSQRQNENTETEGVDDADRDRLQNLPPGIRLMILKERALKSPKITPLVAIPSSNEDNRLRRRRRRHHKRNKKRSGQDSCRRRLIMTAPTVSSARSDKKSQRQNENTETEGVDDADRDRLQNLPPGIRLMILKERALKSPKITPLVAIPSSNEDNRLRRRRRRHHKRNKKRSGQDSCRRRLIMTAPTVSSARSDKKSQRQNENTETEGVDDADRDRLQNLPPGIRLMILKERALKSPKITPLVAIPSSNEDNRLRRRRRRHHKRNKKRSGQDSCRRRLIMTAPTVSSARSDKKSQRQNENTETEGVDDADRDRLQNLPPGIRLMILKERALKSPKITPLVAIPSSNEDNRLRRRRRRHHKRNKKRSGQDSCRRRLIMTAPTVSSARSDKKSQRKKKNPGN